GCAITFWSWIHSRRLLAEHERRVALPDIGEPALVNLAGGVAAAIHQPFLNWPLRVFLAGSVIVGTFSFLAVYIQSFEPPLYDPSYWTVLGLVIFLMFLTLLRFSRSWSKLKTFLEQ